MVTPLRLCAAVAFAFLLSGCISESWSYRAVPDIKVRQADRSFSLGPLVLEASGNHPASVQRTSPGENVPPPRQTVLIASWRRDAAYYPQSLGHTLVLTLDGPPRPGAYWLNSDNSVLISYSAYSAPTRERMNITGSIKIIEVKDKAIVADLAVRDTTDMDTSLFIERPYDPVFWQFPFRLTGRRTFAITRPDDPSLNQPAMKWIIE